MKNTTFFLKAIFSLVLLSLVTNLQAQDILEITAQHTMTTEEKYDSLIIKNGGELILNDSAFTINENGLLRIEDGGKITVNGDNTVFNYFKAGSVIENHTDSSNITGKFGVNFPGVSEVTLKGSKTMKVYEFFGGFEHKLKLENNLYIINKFRSKKFGSTRACQIITDNSTLYLGKDFIFYSYYENAEEVEKLTEMGKGQNHILYAGNTKIIQELKPIAERDTYDIHVATNDYGGLQDTDNNTNIFLKMKGGTLGTNPTVTFRVFDQNTSAEDYANIPEITYTEAETQHARRYLEITFNDVTDPEYDLVFYYKDFDIENFRDPEYLTAQFHDGTSWTESSIPVDPKNNKLTCTGLTATSGVMTAFADWATSVQQINADLQYSLYPNPSNGKFSMMLKGNKTQTVDFAVYNTLGKIVYLESDVNITPNAVKQMNLKGLQQGVYFLKVSDGQNTVVNKIIIK